MEEFEFRALPPTEAIEYFRAKGWAPKSDRFSWRDIWGNQHDSVFTVAKVMRDDVLKEIRGSLDEALVEGVTRDEFIKRIQPKLEAFGWWGTGEEVDPKTGRKELVQLGSPRRLEIIYDTNLRAAYSAGRWERAQRNARLMPYFTYVQIDRPSKREAHKPFDGVTLPVGHEFWRTHWPPNGWKCGCIVRQISKRALEKENLSVTDEERVGEIGRTRDVVDKRNGVTRQVPIGIDPSFERNAGLSRFDPQNP